MTTGLTLDFSAMAFKYQEGAWWSFTGDPWATIDLLQTPVIPEKTYIFKPATQDSQRKSARCILRSIGTRLMYFDCITFLAFSQPTQTLNPKIAARPMLALFGLMNQKLVLSHRRLEEEIAVKQFPFERWSFSFIIGESATSSETLHFPARIVHVIRHVCHSMRCVQEFLVE
jgi:hypothetical protein